MTGQAAAVADPEAREFLRKADPVLGRLIDAHPDFHPRAWMDELPPLDAFGTLVFQVIGQQLSVRATRAILTFCCPATSRCGARSSGPTASTTSRPRTRWRKWRSAGARIGALR
jgi:hypothetical protein